VTRKGAPQGGATAAAAQSNHGESTPTGRGSQAPEVAGRLLARLLDRSAQTQRRGMQVAYLRGRPEQAAELERRARRFEELRDLAHAYDWQPKVRPARLSAEERAELNRMFTSRLQRRSRGTPASPPVVSELVTAHHGNRERSYGRAALYDECRRCATTPAGNRNNTVASAAFKCGQLVGAGLLERNEAYSNLLGAALDSGLPEVEARSVIRTGLSAGAQRPRPLRPVNERPAS
jgi:hypothetical protein